MQLREARRAELADFAAMERQADAAGFILPDTLADHQAAFDRRGVIYLAIEADDASLAGFILIAPEAGGDSVEFRRIVIRDKGRGAGQQAVRLLEDWCRENLHCRRIWRVRIRHRFPAADAEKRTVARGAPVGPLDVVSTTPARPYGPRRAPQRLLDALAT